MDAPPLGARLVENMTPAELERARRVEEVLPALREEAPRVDAEGEFCRAHIERFRQAGLLGLVVPQRYGGLDGTLRDLAAATFAMGAACPSTALAYFFHCSSASRGLLPLEAIEEGLFTPEEIPRVRAFAEKLLQRMGTEGKWLANFASESVKTEQSAISIATEATPVSGGFQLSGVKSFGCATGVADEYLVTAKLAGTTTAEGLALFLVQREAAGVRDRSRWDAIGMRGTATHGIILEEVFVPEEDALAIPAAFTRMMRMSRGSFVGNQLAATAVYAGAAHAAYHYVLEQLMERKFQDSGRPLASDEVNQQLLGRMQLDLETAMLWLRRQLQLETAQPPLLSKEEVVHRWRLCKGEVCEAAFRVVVGAFKAGGTGGTGNSSPGSRALRDVAMGLVQAFPAERGLLMAARMVVEEREQAMFSTLERG